MKTAPGEPGQWGLMHIDDPVELLQLGFSELVGHHDHGLVPDGQEQILDPLGGFGVQVGQRLIQEKYLRIPQKGPGQADALLFTAGEIAAVLVHGLVQSTGQTGKPHTVQDCDQPFVVNGLVQGQIVPQGIPEQDSLLPDHGHQAVGTAVFSDRHSVEFDGAVCGVEISQEQVHRSGFAAAAGAFEQTLFALAYRQTEPVQNGPLAVVGEGYLPEPDIRTQDSRGGYRLDFRGFPEEVCHTFADGLDREQLPDDARQGNQGPGELVDHADGDEEIARGKIPPEHQPAGEHQHDVIGQV